MSILIAYPDIPVNAVRVVTSHAYSDFQPYWNLFKGKRYHHGKLAATTAANRELAFTLQDGLPQSASYCILSRADLLIAQGATSHNLQRSTDGLSWTTVDTMPIIPNNLIGVRSQDLIDTFTQTSTFQYWRSQIVGANAVTRYSKLYFGNMFDIGTHPDSFSYNQERAQSADFEADSGAKHQIQTGLPKYNFRITWEGITDAKCAEMARILKSNYDSLFLYAPTQPQILAGFSLVHVRCLSFQKEDTEGWPNWNRITCSFEELIG
jgi:hypothetical protein